MTVTIAEGCFDPNTSVDDLGFGDDDEFEPSGMTGHYQGGWEAEPAFRIATGTVERAADALLIAADRFMRVGVSGTEYAVGSAIDPEDYTPDICLVTVDRDAAYIRADTSEWLSHEMAATMKRILVEEMTRDEIRGVVSSDYNPIRGVHGERWPRA